VHGALLIFFISYLPHGAADSLALAWRRRRLSRGALPAAEPAA
jgi:hypothetical protein